MYEERAKVRAKNSEVELEPIKTDLIVKEEALNHETSVESPERRQEVFQLQNLLKDASPAILESSVEQGVKLLEALKNPMLNKIGDTPDAKQWIAQIGKHLLLMCYRCC